MASKSLEKLLPTTNKSILRPTAHFSDISSIRDSNEASLHATLIDTFHELRSPLPSLGYKTIMDHMSSIDTRICDVEVFEQTENMAQLDLSDPFSSTNFPSVEYPEAAPQSPTQNSTTTEPFPEYIELMSPSDVTAPGTPFQYDPWTEYPVLPVSVSSSKDTSYLDNDCYAMILTDDIPQLVLEGSASSSSNLESQNEESRPVHRILPAIFVKANEEVKGAVIEIKNPFIKDISANAIVYQDDENESDVRDITRDKGSNVETEISNTDKVGAEQVQSPTSSFTNPYCASNTAPHPSTKGPSFDAFDLFPNDKQRVRWLRNQILAERPFHAFEIMNGFNESNVKYRFKLQEEFHKRVFQELAADRAKARDEMHREMEETRKWESKLRVLHFEELTRWQKEQIRMEVMLENVENGKKEAEQVIENLQAKTQFLQSKVEKLADLMVEIAAKEEEVRKLRNDLATAKRHRKDCFTIIQNLRAKIAVFETEGRKNSTENNTTENQDSERQTDSESTKSLRTSITTTDQTGTETSEDQQSDLSNSTTQIKVKSDENHSQLFPIDTQIPKLIATDTNQAVDETSSSQRNTFDTSETNTKLSAAQGETQNDPRSTTIPEIIITTPDQSKDRVSGIQQNSSASTLTPIKASFKEAEASNSSEKATVCTKSTTSSTPAQAITAREKKWSGLQRGKQWVGKAGKAMKQRIECIIHS